MKKNILLIIVLLFVGLLVVIANIQIPCGGMTEDGTLWDGRCAYGPLLIKNIQKGHFFLPFGYK